MAGESNKPGNHRHTLIMLLGCLAPLAIIMVLWFAGVSQSILTFGIILLCPIMHFVMMRNMKHENVKNGTHNIESKTDNENKREELT